ncbi:SWIB/MDM2 domain-containing protein (plasmid) [Polymorphobacter sp. PAMC 29334]|uniref:SWIB/MDM2 domain-containing protein n=1 Tax=Polymorphobacter sp. PAMC 29334 TaxID=2862331 RepID=UPI001C792EA8|nr:SWIB/MDM2 domain-containing protein [Polymorphobacter sp. PAMC 29334]QYE37280.1 SWIB/MDM2 domain-containing protein [Polymorphobacter sp. PAMC 29334]
MADGTTKTSAKKAKSPAGASNAPKTGGFNTPVTPSPQLAAIVGDKPLPRSEIVSLMWVYIKEHKLQDAKDGRQINADAKLEAIFGKKQASMFELSKYIAAHVK